MIEVEIKAKILDGAALEKTIATLGFVKKATLKEEDIYYNGSDRDFRKTDEALRIRSCRGIEENTEKNALTYKGPKLGNESQTRQELEISFCDSQTMGLILSALGYSPILEVKKQRKVYAMGDITACIDCVDSLGDYLELEKLVADQKDYPKAVDQLYEWLSKLGISKTSLTQSSYLELLINQMK